MRIDNNCAIMEGAEQHNDLTREESPERFTEGETSTANEKVGPLTEIDLLRWENELLKREKELNDREKINLSRPDARLEERRTNSSNSLQNDFNSFKMGIGEVRTLIAEFNPTAKSNISSAHWIQSIENLKNIYGWDDRTTLFYATLRLGGAVSFWYQAKQDMLQTFEIFKKEFVHSFPSGQDDASILMEIMQRKRLPGEPIEDYLYEVAALGKRINLPEHSIIRYITSGLSNQNLINVLLSSNCSTVTDILTQVKNFEEIQKQGYQRQNLYRNNPGPSAIKQYSFRNNNRFAPLKNNRGRSEDDNKEHRSFYRQKDEKKDTTENRRLLKCFKCSEIGHFARNCRGSNETKKCFHCQQTGHLARDCKVKQVSTVTEASLQREYKLQDEYHKIIKVDGKDILAFFDLGSDCTTIREDALEKYSWEMDECNTKLVGFGGMMVNVLGKITKQLSVNDITFLIDVMVVNKLAQKVPMIVGRNFMDRPGIQIIKRWGIFELEKINPEREEVNKKTSDRAPIAVEDITVGSKINNDEKNALIDLVNNFRDCFAKGISELGKTNLVEMEIKLKENKVIRYHPYKIAYGLKSILRKHINELLELDVIQSSSSEYASPVILVPKKNGEFRMCVDYRKINSITQRETFPVPNIEDTLNSLANKKIFTMLDLLSGYHQIPIASNSRHLTAFVTPEGHYEFKRVPFGLTNSPAVFMKLMDKISREIGREKIIVYMDDVLIPTTTVEENLNVLKEFLTELRKASLTLNIKKCSFFLKDINFLGHEISEDGIKPGINKIIAVRDYKRPENIRELRQFLGLAGYFRRFIQGFSNIAQPLNKLLRKNENFEWTSETEDSFNHLKELLSQRPLLALYDDKANHEVHTDASSHGIAGILMQEKGGSLRPISYFSRATTPTEAKYHSYELECLAVVESLERFKHYLLQRKFKIVTDCNSLRLTQEKKDLIPRIARWWLKISEFQFELIFRPGSKLAHADALSRCPVENGAEPEDIAGKMLIVGIPEEDWLAVLQGQDPRLAEIRKVLGGEITVHKDKDGIKGNFILKQGRIFKKTNDGDRFAIPNGLRWRIIKAAHDDMGHPGIERTLETVKKYTWFSSMKPVIAKYIKSCMDCLYNKRGIDESRYHIHIPEIKPIPFHTPHVDHLGLYPKSKSGNMYVIGMVDAFTKVVILSATRNTTSKGVIQTLEDITQYFGTPSRIISDRGTAFTSSEFQKFCQENAIKHVLTAVKTPRANGQVERYFRTTKTAIATMSQDAGGRDWDTNLRAIQWALNSLKNTTTQVAPQTLVMNYQPRDILKNKLLLALHDTFEKEEEENIPLAELREVVLRRVKEKQQCQADKFNKTHKAPRKYQEGDLVLIRQEPLSSGQPRKVQPKYKGPYAIKAVLCNDRYVITDTKELQVSRKPYESVQSAERMKPFCSLQEIDFDEYTSEEESAQE